MRSITFKRATENDVLLIYQWWTNGQVMASVGFPNGLETTKEEVKRTLKSYQRNPTAEFLLIMNEDNVPIGEFTYHQKAPGMFTFNIKMGKLSEQGKGYGRLAIIEGIERIAENYLIEAIQLEVDPKNNKAMNLYKSLGFKCQKISYRHWFNQLKEPCATAFLEKVFDTP